MNVLLLGSGGREHALAWKLAQSPTIGKLFAAPGNPGIANEAQLVAIDAADHDAVIAFCRAETIGLVVIGPEAPLVDGLGDALRAAGIPVFGPNKDAAQLEGSKSFTKALCDRAGIPTAAYFTASSTAEAMAALDRFALPVVIKADGLAAGKGVVIAETLDEAQEAIEALGGGPLVLEEFLEGEEASLFAISDGTRVVAFGSAQDHKRVGDGDVGPNTGGMGAYSPARVLTSELEAHAMAEIVMPTVRAMAAEGIPYSGVLYAGLMLTADGPKLIEYNARFGDPEAQVLMMRYQGDLLALMLATAEGRLADFPAPSFSEDVALTVVMAAKGYPGVPEKGGRISGIKEAEGMGANVFHAGTAVKDGAIVANGGRVLNVTAVGASVRDAQTRVYRAIDAIDFPTGFCRSDIGWREVAREES
jgi:phosphoribosylamine--glycine ligase